MARRKSIPPELVDEVVRLAGEGQSTRKIAAWLKSQHQVEASHSAVARLLECHKTAGAAGDIAGRAAGDVAGSPPQAGKKRAGGNRNSRAGGCQATTKKKGRCPNRPVPGTDRCELHTEGEARRRMLSERGKRGREVRAEKEQARREEVHREVITGASLRTIEDLRGALERALTLVETSDGVDPIDRLQAVARAVAVAAKLLETGDLAAQVEELRRIVVAAHPGLAGTFGRAMQ